MFLFCDGRVRANLAGKRFLQKNIIYGIVFYMGRRYFVDGNRWGNFSLSLPQRSPKPDWDRKFQGCRIIFEMEVTTRDQVMEDRSLFSPGRLWRWLWLLALISGLWVLPAVAENR